MKVLRDLQGNPHLTADFSAETLQARKEWDDILKVLKGKKIANEEYSKTIL
jgi:hypothetical protein